MSDTRPLFSILHASARPDKWREIYDAWIGNAVDRSQVEYILVCDERWGFSTVANHLDGPDKVLWNDARRCSVDSWNLAAQAATGQILILAADDVYPPDRWDALLNLAVSRSDNESGDFVMHVSTGTDGMIGGTKYATGLLIISRGRYERLDYALCPEYTGMWSDVEFWVHAEQDKCIVDATALMFEHRHPILTRPDWKDADAVYAEQNRAEHYEEGKRIFDRRMRDKFKLRAGRPSIAMCLPGEHFSSPWVVAYTGLLMSLIYKGYPVVPPFFSFSSNVYITRSVLANAVLGTTPAPDYVLWLDDDNLLTCEQFELLLSDLENNPDISAVAGWTWVQPDGQQIECTMSAGKTADDGTCTPMPLLDLLEARDKGELLEVDYFGFPAVLMSYSTLVKAGKFPFAPQAAPDYAFGFMGEDAAFCRAARERGGCRFFVDPRVQLPHMKLRDVGSTPLQPAIEAATVSPGHRAEKENN